MLITGDELRYIFEKTVPFEPDGRLKPDEQRLTILAANANMPVEMFGRALVMAAANDKGSPLIIQMSYNALKAAGGAQDSFRTITGTDRTKQPCPLVSGAQIASYLIEEFTEHYAAEHVALSLDHFKVPSMECRTPSKSRSKKVARARIEEAADAAIPLLPEHEKPDGKMLERYVEYLCSEEYACFKRDFLQVVQFVEPAWGMIDTEKLPPVLNYAVTKEIADAVREDLGNKQMMLEAEYGATGESGGAISYKRLEAGELDAFSKEVASFVKYTGADGIAYPIGMEHAARKHEAHEPDTQRLLEVQREILRVCGRYVPFAQHGGTGAARLERGLVGKNNVNTLFLVTGASSFADWVSEYRQQISAGDKKAGGLDMYVEATLRIAEACVEKLKETGSFNAASWLFNQ